MGPFLSALHRSSGKQKEFLWVFSLTRWSKIINKNHNLLTDFLQQEFKMISSHLGPGDCSRGNFGLIKHIIMSHYSCPLLHLSSIYQEGIGGVPFRQETRSPLLGQLARSPYADRAASMRAHVSENALDVNS